MRAVLGSIAMVFTVFIAAATLGHLVLAWCRGGENQSLALRPVVGLVIMILWLNGAAWFVAPGSTALLAGTGTGLAVFSALTWRRRRSKLGVARRDVAWLAAVVVVGLIAGAPLLAFIHRSGSTTAVQLTPNNDAYYFVAIPEWLKSHSATASPHLVPESPVSAGPAYGSVADRYGRFSLRIGTESLIAAISRVSSIDPVELWLSLTISFLVIVACAAFDIAWVVTRDSRWAIMVCAAVTLAAQTLGEAIDQHTPTLLALAVFLVLLSQIFRATREGSAPVSALLTGVLAAGVTAVYGELYTLVLLPAAVLLVLSTVRGRVRPQWLLRMAVISAVAGTYPWIRSLKAAFRSKPPVGLRSAFARSNGWVTLADRLAFGSQRSVVRIGTSPRFALVVLAGFIAALVIGYFAILRTVDHRAWWVALAATTLLGWFVLGRHSVDGYSQQRFVEWSVPLIVAGAALGWVRVGQGDRTSTRPVRRQVAAGVALLALTLPGLANLRNIHDDPGRRVDSTFREASSWLSMRDPTGIHTIVWAHTFFENVWTPYMFRAHRRLSYLTMYRGYFDTDRFGPLGGRRWILLDRDALTSASIPPGALVATNTRFALVDSAQSPVELRVVPTPGGRWTAFAQPVVVHLIGGKVLCTATAQRIPCNSR
ncbi:MAG: hypothetical protein JWM05_626 [Acidimicrobiales bacterium]|nr:hypothetical protein [Acidimicrobiales bacterium]